MKLTKKPGKKRMILMFMALLCVIALAGVSMGAYTRQASMRGVLRNRDTDLVRFTSDYLQNCAMSEKSYARQTISLSKETDPEKELTLRIYVYNYANGNETLVSEKDITYNMEISFSGGTGAETAYKVEFGGQNIKPENGSYKINDQTLVGRTAKQHVYTVKFPAGDLDKLQITAVATPTNPSVTNNQKLAAVIMPCTGSVTNDFSFSGKYTDKSDTTTPPQYGGFNYEVQISSGIAEATLTWKPEYVEIDKYFLVNIGKSPDEISQILQDENLEDGTLKEKSITFTMNQADGTGDYLIPFYIKNKDNIPDTWDKMEAQKIIQFKAELKKQTTNSDETEKTE